MVFNIKKETWEKCVIKTIEHYNEKEDIIELWKKMNDVRKQTRHLNIAEVVLGRIRKNCGKKKRHCRRRKTKI